MKARASRAQPELEALAGVARVARVLVGIGGLSELSDHAMTEIRESLGLDLAALYLADTARPQVLRRIGMWATPESTTEVSEVLSLDPEAWQFVTSAGGPLVFREPSAPVMAQPFQPAVDHWVVLPLVAGSRTHGAVVGCAPQRISLEPAAIVRLTVIADLLSAGATNALLRAEVQRSELERERMRVAQEIHDTVAQDLAAAVRELALLESEPPADVAQASRDRLGEAVREAHRMVRRHLDVLSGEVAIAGPGATIDELCSKFRRRGLSVSVGPLPDHERLEPSALAVLLRILNEALANVAAHAGVKRAFVSFSADGATLRMTVRDDGQGFDTRGLREPDSGHFGLALMRERAREAGASLVIRSRPGAGTTVELSLPLTASAA